MRNLGIWIVFLTLFTSVVSAQHPNINITITSELEQPPYAKWGRLAMQETKKKYPQAEIIDYLHVGRKTLSPTTTQETFKLWLKQDHREFGVYVRIIFDTATEKIESISFEETNR